MAMALPFSGWLDHSSRACSCDGKACDGRGKANTAQAFRAAGLFDRAR
jgi:hypothetical protein